MSFSNDSVVNSFYLAYYGRPADPAGMAFWSQQLQSANGDFGAIIDAFSTSPEATAHFGTADTAARITSIYQQLFGRGPEKAGLDYWVDAIAKGQVSIGAAAIEIMRGAQGTDAGLSNLRQQAADQFTAEVAASGSAYHGMAASDAGRVLIQAVSLGATPSDIGVMVKSAAALADIATQAPAVIDALGANLAGLFSSARGAAEPVQLMQALADVAKAASGNPATLDSLLHGGGMAAVLDAMPSDVTLHDVVGALASGGLPAAVDVVYPPMPVAGTLSFVGLQGGSAGALPVTNNAAPPVALHGNDPDTTVAYQMSSDRIHWVSPQDIGAQADGAYYFRAVVTDANGHSSVSNVIGSVLDRTAPAPGLPRLAPNDHQLALGETLTFTIKFSETVNVDANAAPGIALNTGGAAVYQSGAGTDTLLFSYTPAAGENVAQLMTAANGALHGAIVDRAGNAVAAAALDGLLLRTPVRVDTEAPQQTLTVHTVDMLDGVSAEATVAAPLTTNLATTALHATLSAPLASDETVEYSLDNGAHWQAAQVGLDGLQVTVANIASTAGPTVMLRVSDLAGNHGAVVSQAVVYDADAPTTGILTLVSITHGAADGAPADNVTNAATADVQFSFTGTLGAGDALQYSTDGSTWRAMSVNGAAGTATIQGLDLTHGTPGSDGNLTQTVLLRAVDGAGNASPTTTTTLVYDNHAAVPTVALASDTGSSDSDHVTSAGSLSVSGLEAGAKAEYSSDGLTGWSDTAPVLVQGMNTVHVHQVDAAGNVSDAATIVFQYDSFAPNTPGVVLATDSGSDSHDGVTNAGTVTVSGLEHGNGSTWEYSLDGQSWLPGATVDSNGNATLTLSGDGPKTVLVHQTDLAGHTSGNGTLSFTLDATLPASVSFAQVEGAAAGTPDLTSLSSADVGFTFAGTLAGWDTVQYRIDSGAWITVDGANGSVDTNAGTITIKDVALDAGDPTVSVRIVDLAGNTSSASQKIDGPYEDLQFTATGAAGGLQITTTAANNAYLGASATPLTSTLGGGVVAGTTTFGVQGAPFQGTLSLGADRASALADTSGATYALGTNGNDTLTGQYVWGFGGRDTLIGTAGNDFLYGGADGHSTIRGGLGADTVTVHGTYNLMAYTNAAESHVVGGSAPATGFDTVYTDDLGFLPNVNQLLVTTPILIQGYNLGMNMAFSGGSGDSLLAALNAAAPTSYANAALLFDVSDQEHYLVVADATPGIDSNDFVIKIVGKIADFGVDFDTNTVMAGVGYPTE